MPSKESRLDKVHQSILSDYPDLSHISRDALENQMGTAEIIIFDTRPIVEYEISHIKGAIQIDPDMHAEQFRKKFSQAIKNKHIMLYCSVGRRSSKFGDRIEKTAMMGGGVRCAQFRGRPVWLAQ